MRLTGKTLLTRLWAAATGIVSPGVAGFILAIPASSMAAESLSLGGSGFIQFGRVMNSSDTSQGRYTGNTTRASGAQLLMKSSFSERLDAAIGVGVVDRHFLAGAVGSSAGRAPLVVTPYIAQANFTYSFWNADGAKLRLTGGYFPYNYNPEVRNLGLYLLRGPVYPGFLLSGFDARHVTPAANLLGFRLQHQVGPFEQNLILNSETELYPLFDVSPAYLAAYKVGGSFRIGAGVNFYHYLPIDPRTTSPDTLSFDGADTPTDKVHPYQRAWAYVDPVTQDTTRLSFKGTKVMVNAMADLKGLTGDLGVLGEQDLKLYAEVALIGLDNRKPYRDVYGEYRERMPVMLGFNFPAFRILDRLAMEVEWYGAKFRDDLVRYQPNSSTQLSPLPSIGPSGADTNMVRDDWKWSVYGSRDIGNVRLIFQVANDHSRPGGTILYPNAEWQALYVTPEDWYWMTKVAFFF